MASEQTNLEFLTELRQLLERYNADIWVDLTGDMSDLNGVDYSIILEVDNQEIFRSETGISSQTFINIV